MNVTIGKDALVSLIKRGGLAALSDIAQTDSSSVGPIVRSIKLNVEDSRIVASSCNELMGIRYVVNKEDTEELTIESTGIVVVDAKDLLTWTDTQSDGTEISMKLTPIEETEALIPRNGKIDLVAKGQKGSVSEWSLDSFDPSKTPVVDFEEDSLAAFTMNGGVFRDDINKVAFSAQKNDYQHKYDNVLVQTQEEGRIAFVATDTKRCAVKFNNNSEGITGNDVKILIPAAMLAQISGILDESKDVTMSYNEESGKVFVRQNNIVARLSGPPKEAAEQYPNVLGMLNLSKYTRFLTISKKEMSKLLGGVAIVNKGNSLFSFDSAKSSLVVQTKSEGGSKRPLNNKAQLDNVEFDVKNIWNSSYILSALKEMKSDKIELHVVTESPRALLITGSDDDDFAFMTVKLSDSKYEV